MSPYKMLFKKQSDIGNIHTFVCDVYIRINDTLRTDMDPNSTLRYYLGPISKNGDTFHMFNQISKEIGLSRDGYKFDDNMLLIRNRSEV